MSIADEIRKLQELHTAGALTDAEFAQAKARVLAGTETASAPEAESRRDQLAEMRRQQALDRLDRAWDRERERYLVTSRYGNRYTPSRANSLVAAVGIMGFGAIWVFMIAGFGGGIRGSGWFPVIGLVFTAVGLGTTAIVFIRANSYEQAHRRYQRQRALLLSAGDDPVDDTAVPFDRQAESTAIQDLRAPAPCGACGQAITAGQSQCPHCGWTNAVGA